MQTIAGPQTSENSGGGILKFCRNARSTWRRPLAATFELPLSGTIRDKDPQRNRQHEQRRRLGSISQIDQIHTDRDDIRGECYSAYPQLVPRYRWFIPFKDRVRG